MKLIQTEFSKEIRKDGAFVDFANNIINLINNARYQMRIVTSVPTWIGEEGEFLLYILSNVRRWYWYDSVNNTWQYVEWNTSGLGNPTIVGNIELTAQTGNIATTTIYTPPTAGLYRVSVYQICKVAGTAGTLNTTIGWTDAVGAKTLSPAGNIVLDSVANGSTGMAFISSGVSAITFASTITGGTGSPQFNLYIALEKIS